MKKRILVTGGTGTFGKAFVQYAKERSDVEKVFIYSRDEMKQWNMHKNFRDNSNKIKYIIGDVRDLQRLKSVIRDNKIDYVVHAAATKIVLSAEFDPEECIKTNINGAINVIEACKSNKVKKVIALSTDKASNPINLYGATKLASDKLFISANSELKNSTNFSVVRYGNVMGSRGSVIPFYLSINNNTYPITDKNMTRFVTTVDQSIETVIFALNYSNGGEIFIRKSPSIKILDLGKYINNKAKFKVTGIRPGEKIHEQLIGLDEARYTYEIEDYYIIISPLFEKKKYRSLLKNSKKVGKSFIYTSDNNKKWLSINQFNKWFTNFKKLETLNI